MNKFLTIDEYLEQIPNKKCTQNYIRSFIGSGTKTFPPQILKQGMLKVEDESACCWGGPFKGNYIFCKIEDYSLTVGELKSLAEIAEHWETYIQYSTHNILYSGRALKKYFPELQEWYFIQKTKDGSECSRTQFTHSELLHYLNNATKEELEHRQQMIREERERLITNRELSIELPIKFFLCGNDDTSWTNYYATSAEALVDFDFLLNEQPDIGYIQRNFVFTN